MFMNNYINISRARFTGGLASLTCTDGTQFNEVSAGNYTQLSSLGYLMGKVYFGAIPQTAGTANSGMYFGSGATPPTRKDTTLESVITSGLSCAAGKIVIAPGSAGKYLAYVDHVLTNTSEQDIAIREVGLVGGSCWQASTTSQKYYAVLLERTVLDEPFVIPAGKSRLFTYKLTFNQP